MLFGFHWLAELMLVVCLAAFFWGRPVVSRWSLFLIILGWIGVGVAGNSMADPVNAEFVSWFRWLSACMTLIVVMPSLMGRETDRQR